MRRFTGAGKICIGILKLFVIAVNKTSFPQLSAFIIIV